MNTPTCRTCGFTDCPNADGANGWCPRWHDNPNAGLFLRLSRPELDCLLADAEHAYVKSQVALSAAPLDHEKVYAAAGVAADCLGMWQDALDESIHRMWTQ